MPVELRESACAVCGTHNNATEVYSANFHPGDFSPAVFSARRLPDRIHYRMVRCNTCGLVRSDPVGDTAAVSELYRQSTFDYSEETHNLARTYGAYLARLDARGARKGRLLEIGCGNGFFLEQAQRQGYTEVAGVEPSRAAIDAARPDIRRGITCAMMGPGLFPDASFDVICMFQVLDHIFNPGAIVKTCYDMLKPGGFVLCLNHNMDAMSSRWLKERSPIIDIEHTYLYSPVTIGKLFGRHGFDVKETGTVRNRYSLTYLTRLLPLPDRVKQACLAGLCAVGLGHVPLSVPLGNLYMIAAKPAGTGA